MSTPTERNGQPRQPKGTPTGGEFAHKNNAPDDLSGLEATPSAMSHEDAAQLLADALQSARAWSSRNRTFGGSYFDADDVASDAALQVLEAEARGNVITHRAAYMDQVARVFNMRDLPSADGAALRQLAVECGEFAQRHGRAVTPMERRDIAHRIRENWHDPRHRPRLGYEDHIRVDSLDRIVISADGELLDASDIGASPMYTSPEQLAQGSLADRVVSSVEDAGRTAVAKRHAWNSMAEMVDGPKVEFGSLSRHGMTAARKAVDQAGGPQKVLADYQAGKRNAATEALFAPWGGANASESSRAGAVAVMERHPNYAGELWGSALSAAGSRQADEDRQFTTA